jgi:hypothetical protein
LKYGKVFPALATGFLPNAFCPIILLDRVFFSPYTLTGKKEILIKQAVCAGAGQARRFVRQSMSANAIRTGRPFAF